MITQVRNLVEGNTVWSKGIILRVIQKDEKGNCTVQKITATSAAAVFGLHHWNYATSDFNTVQMATPEEVKAEMNKSAEAAKAARKWLSQKIAI